MQWTELTLLTVHAPGNKLDACVYERLWQEICCHPYLDHLSCKESKDSQLVLRDLIFFPPLIGWQTTLQYINTPTTEMKGGSGNLFVWNTEPMRIFKLSYEQNFVWICVMCTNTQPSAVQKACSSLLSETSSLEVL